MELGAVAVADEDECAGPRLKHEGKVLGAHHRRNVWMDLVLPYNFARNRDSELGLRRVVYGRRVSAAIIDASRRSGSSRETCYNFVYAFLDVVARRCL